MIGNITGAWQVFTGYTSLDSEILRSNSRDANGNPNEQGNPVGNMPKDTFGLWTTYALTGGFEFGLGAQYVGSRMLSNTNTSRLDSYWLFDAMAGCW